MKWRALALVLWSAACGCAPDDLDLGYDRLPIGTGGSTGTGGAGGAPVCTAGETQECYSGPAGTKGQGICKAGQRICAKDGSGFGACMGEVLPKPEDCATPLDEDCDGAFSPCLGTVLWAKRYGDSGSQFARAVATDSSGNLLLVGSFLGSLDFGGTPLTAASPFYADVFAAKLDTDGKHQWSHSYGKSLSQRAWAVAADTSGNAFLIGDFDGEIDFGDGAHASTGGADLYLAKLDPNGDVSWAKTFGDAQAQAGYAVTCDAAGNVIIAGAFAGTLTFGGETHASVGGTDVFIAKLDDKGALLWSKSFGATEDQAAFALGTDAAGHVVVAGVFAGTINFGDGQHQSAGGTDAFVAAFDPDGAAVWSRTFGGPLNQAAYGLTVAPSGEIGVAGAFSGSIDFGDGPIASAGGADVFVAKLAAGGTKAWIKTFGDTADIQAANSVAFDNFGNLVVAGAFNGAIDFGNGPLTSGGGSDMFVAKLAEDGAAVWSKRFGDKGTQVVTRVATDPKDAIFVTGYLDGTVDVGSMTLTSAGAEDVVVAKLSP